MALECMCFEVPVTQSACNSPDYGDHLHVSQHITLTVGTLRGHGLITGELPFLYKRNKSYFAK